MSKAQYGIVAYPLDYVAKSGVFAAYCAHGTCPILLSDDYLPSDQLIPRKNFIPGFSSLKESGIDTASIGFSAWNWYQPHRIAVHANTIEALVIEAKKSC
ncbi:MAG: hypothetical protein IPP59_17265 [Betaproteobacteria bacterium]|nr:hypothetical protein [Candidatus Dechloromonas phosphorivorans]